MTKQSGLGDRLFVGGYDLSGDVGAIQAVNASQGLQDVTGIDKSAYERLGLLRDGEISFNNFFNDEAGQAHPVLKALQAQADVHVMYLRGTSRGNQSACLIAKQVNYNLNRGADGSLLGTVQTQGSAGYGTEWGRQMTAGKENLTGAGNLTSIDLGSAGTRDRGLVAYLQVMAFSGTSVTFKFQESSDNGSSDAFADVSGGAFAAVSSAPNTQRIATSATQTIERYLRVNAAGTFSNVDFAIVVIVPGAHSG